MTEEKTSKMINKEIAKPLYYQQLERSLDIQPFLSYVETLFKQPIRDNEGSSDSDANTDPNFSYSQWDRMHSTKQDRRSDKMRLYNFSHIQCDRLWLQNILVSDSSDSSEDDDDKPITERDLQEMLKLHLYKKKYKKKFYSSPDNRQYQYYGAGLLSTYDKFSEHQTNIVGNKKKKKSFVLKKERIKREEKELSGYRDDQDRDSIFEDGRSDLKFTKASGHGGKMSKNKKKAQQIKNPEVMAHRRRKIWAIMSKKELGKVQRAKINNHKEVLTSCRRVAQYCMRYWRQKAMQSQKNMKETIWRAKRLSREMQSHWRRYDRVERETRRRMEKEAEEQRKMDVELMEAKRQQRKLNFLITQTELYAHFMSRKLGNASHEEQLRILSQLEEEKNPRLAAIDDYDSEVLKEKVKLNVRSAFEAEEQRTRQFGANLIPKIEPLVVEEERPQPSIFKGTLKGYQLKGMNWLANLYDQGINGILADEMGLGKTVQSIAFLCHIAEKYSVWGPFLIISPASTLHNWQQEMARFVPEFKVVPYWGSPQERKILRQFWDQKDLHTQDASFHVVITSYQLVITDFKYFNRIKWQYLILDEAQAIKSTSSVWWKLLLGVSCRNRLLLSGTPIQNSMAELWALLHFIMPTMFDSHDEFNEWFSTIVLLLSSVWWKLLLGVSCRNRLLLSGTPIQNSMAELWALLHFIMPTMFDSHDEFNEWFSTIVLLLSSVWWKLLLGVSCRNRLLLSGTPIQNSMAELWALLHFIMPTMFDSHDEFNEWFSTIVLLLSSVWWKLLLGVSCRNRLLLSGTPIQNSMAELWALLHFIMPTMFDSHDEFNEWFSTIVLLLSSVWWKLLLGVSCRNRLLLSGTPIQNSMAELWALLHFIMPTMFDSHDEFNEWFSTIVLLLSSVWWKLLLGVSCRNRLLLSGTPIQNSMAELWALLHFIMPTMFDSHDEFNEWFSTIVLLSSVRWKLLLGFSCHNRLLLSGTPIQNSMAELWALLHFIMPTMFDSHDEFNEWFSTIVLLLSSVRWKLLLGFSCRNRLLLSGTPIQNSMAELWALLHFIMPTMFDSHDEFNEWFSTIVLLLSSVRWKLLLGFSCCNRLLLSRTPIQNSMAELWALLHFIMPTMFDSHDEFNEWFSTIVLLLSSVRWKLLLGFSCRNRLLLSGTPIQNSMAELWALLHFIMPTMFDSHDEFNEWFSTIVLLLSSVRWKLLLGFSCCNRLLLSRTPIQNSMAELWALLHFIMPTMFDSHDEFNEWFSTIVLLLSSVRWKLLLGFSCRNRLLLSGTPIQNSMAELWALLHFIMPTMFDSHDEFNEWFSKDIESHAENKTSIDERHLSRLHLILKPFMLRRIKKDVENELSDKIEVMVCCPLTTRQKVLYSALKKKIRIEDLLHSSGPYQSSQSITSSLMNLVMQFRKVCNHPELFERQEAKSPLWTQCGESLYVVPRLVFEEGMLYRAVPSVDHILYNLLSILHQRYVHHSLFSEHESDRSDCFGFSRLVGLSPEEVFQLTVGGLLKRWLHLAEQLDRRPALHHRQVWWGERSTSVVVAPRSASVPPELVFTDSQGHRCVFSHNTVRLHSMPETVEHRVMRCRKQVEGASTSSQTKGKMEEVKVFPEFPHVERPPLVLECHPTILPRFLYNTHPKVEAKTWKMYSSSRRAAWWLLAHDQCTTNEGQDCVRYGSPRLAEHYSTASQCFHPLQLGGMMAVTPLTGWSHISIPDKETLVTDCGKLFVLDSLLERLKQQGHRVLIYSQMTRMIDLLEEYMWHRKLTYMRLDGSSKISDRRDMVADFQARTDIFVFLLSTRAGGLGINLTAADTVIFYDSDWNPTVDQQAMDRAHRLGQTKQVTVYRLICKGTIEERILQRAREKSEIQRMVISGGNFKSDTLKPKEVVSLLLDDEEIEKKYRQKQAERRKAEEYKAEKEKEKERKRKQVFGPFKEPVKHIKLEEGMEEGFDSTPASPAHSEASGMLDDTSSDALVVDVDGPSTEITPQVRSHGSKRGRPRGSRRGGLTRGAIQASSISLGVQGIKRGPGRPRLRPAGPGNVGGRGSPRQRGLGRGLGATTPASTSTTAPIEPIKPFGYYMQDLEIMPLDRDTS